MKPKYLISKARQHLRKGTLVGTAAQRVFTRAPFTKAVNTRPYNAVYGRMVKRKAGAFDADPGKVRLDINIETTNVCNAKCVFCPRESMTRAVGFMEKGFFKEIVDKIAASGLKINSITLNGFGEPLIDPLIFERIGYVKKKLACNTIFYTNAALLDEKKGAALIKSGLDEMNISFNGITPEGYEKTMVNLKYSSVEENIVRFMKQRKEAGLTKPYVYMSCIYTDKEFKRKAFTDKWKNIVDSIFVMPAEKWGSIESDDIPYERLPYRPREWPCKRLWSNVWIAWNGDVHVCCKDYNGSTVMGNMRDGSLEDIWRGDRFTAYRRLHLAGRYGEIPICRGCGALIRNSVLWWNHR